MWLATQARWLYIQYSYKFFLSFSGFLLDVVTRSVGTQATRLLPKLDAMQTAWRRWATFQYSFSAGGPFKTICATLSLKLNNVSCQFLVVSNKSIILKTMPWILFFTSIVVLLIPLPVRIYKQLAFACPKYSYSAGYDNSLRYSRLTRYLCVFPNRTLSICRENSFLSSYMPCSVHFVGNRFLTNDILRLAISINLYSS